MMTRIEILTILKNAGVTIEEIENLIIFKEDNRACPYIGDYGECAYDPSDGKNREWQIKCERCLWDEIFMHYLERKYRMKNAEWLMTIPEEEAINRFNYVPCDMCIYDRKKCADDKEAQCEKGFIKWLYAEREEK